MPSPVVVVLQAADNNRGDLGIYIKKIVEGSLAERVSKVAFE